MINKSSLNVIGCYFLWGLLPIFWKTLSNVNSVYVLAVRTLFTCLFCILVIILKKNMGAIKSIIADKKERRTYLLCGILISINWGVYILTVALGRILEASLAYYLNPLISVLIGALFFKEKLSKTQWVSIAIAFAGVAFAIVRYGSVPYYALIIGLSFAFYGAIKKNVKSDSEVSICMETMSVLPLALGFIVYAMASGLTSFDSLSGKEMLMLVSTGLVTAVPLMLFAKGVKNTPFVHTGIFMYINPTMQLLLGVFLYNEEFTKTNAITFAFVWLAVIIFVTDSIIRSKKTVLT